MANHRAIGAQIKKLARRAVPVGADAFLVHLAADVWVEDLGPDMPDEMIESICERLRQAVRLKRAIARQDNHEMDAILAEMRSSADESMARAKPN